MSRKSSVYCTYQTLIIQALTLSHYQWCSELSEPLGQDLFLSQRFVDNGQYNSHSIALAWFVTKLLHLEAVTPDDGIQIISLFLLLILELSKTDLIGGSTLFRILAEGGLAQPFFYIFWSRGPRSLTPLFLIDIIEKHRTRTYYPNLPPTSDSNSIYRL